MGSDRNYPEEAPAHDATIGPFAIDPTPVTNAEFAAFVDATGYLTLAERCPDAADYPDADPALLIPGSAVFTAPAAPLRGPADWWIYRPGAQWRVPQSDSLPAIPSHPVVHIALADAAAYADWAGKSLPTRLNGNSLPVAARRVTTHGATTSCPVAFPRPTRGIVAFRSSSSPPKDFAGHRR